LRGELSGGLSGTREVLLVGRVRAAAERAEVVEGQTCQRAKVAVAAEARQPGVFALVLRTLTRERFAEVRMTEANGLAHEAGTAAAGTRLFVFLRYFTDVVGT
jgi:hypothetical protein